MYSILEFIKNYWFIISVPLSFMGILYFSINKHKKAKKKFTDHFFRMLNNESVRFFYQTRVRDMKRAEDLTKNFGKRKINFIGGDTEDTTSFAIMYAKKLFNDRIIGIDCISLKESIFESMINEIMYLFKYNQLLIDIIDTLSYQLIKDENNKNRNIMDKVERISELCKRNKYILILFNIDSVIRKQKRLVKDQTFLSFIGKMPNLIITSKKAVMKSDRVINRFWLSGLDYLSFCTTINHKYFKGENDIHIREKKYLDETVSNMSLQGFNSDLVLDESNKKFYIDTYALIKNKTQKFNLIKENVLDIPERERDKNIRLTERVFLKKEIRK